MQCDQVMVIDGVVQFEQFVDFLVGVVDVGQMWCCFEVMVLVEMVYGFGGIVQG